MNNLEVFHAYADMSNLQMQEGDTWVNCVIKYVRMGGTTGIEEVELMILDSEGYPSNAPNQILSQKNFHRLRKRQA